MHKGESEWTQTMIQMLTRSILGAVVALAVSILFLMFASVGISVGWIKETMMGQITVISCVVGAFVGGILSSKEPSGKSLLRGILVGAFQFALMLMIGTAVYGVTELDKESMVLLAACLCGGTLSGLMLRRAKAGVKRAGQGRNKRRRR